MSMQCAVPRRPGHAVPGLRTIATAVVLARKAPKTRESWHRANTRSYLLTGNVIRAQSGPGVNCRKTGGKKEMNKGKQREEKSLSVCCKVNTQIKRSQKIQQCNGESGPAKLLSPVSSPPRFKPMPAMHRHPTVLRLSTGKVCSFNFYFF